MPRINVSPFTWRQEIKHPVDTNARYLIACRPVTIGDTWRAFVHRHICCRWGSDWSFYFVVVVCLPVDSCHAFPLGAPPHLSESPVVGIWIRDANVIHIWPPILPKNHWNTVNCEDTKLPVHDCYTLEAELEWLSPHLKLFSSSLPSAFDVSIAVWDLKRGMEKWESTRPPRLIKSESELNKAKRVRWIISHK